MKIIFTNSITKVKRSYLGGDKQRRLEEKRDFQAKRIRF